MRGRTPLAVVVTWTGVALVPPAALSFHGTRSTVWKKSPNGI